MGLHFASAEPRVTRLAMFAPATDLRVVREFADLPPDLMAPLVVGPERLTRTAIWLGMNSADDRVGTSTALALVGAIAEAGKGSANIEVKLDPGHGHTLSQASRTAGKQWLDRTE
jgi:hypothetical protein